MVDDDPFADLGETLEETPDEDTPSPGESSDSTSDSEYDPSSDPAFSYEDAHQRPFYARDGTISEFDSWLNYELERELSERGYRNIVVREMTDALLRTVVEEDLVDEVARRFERGREEQTDS